MKNIGIYLLASLMILGAIGHLVSPQFYAPMVPDFIPLALANIASFVVELAIGMGLIFPSTRRLAGLGFALLMVAFLPIHVWDLLRDDPAIGSFSAAVIRLVLQFGLIYVGYRIWKRG